MHRSALAALTLVTASCATTDPGASGPQVTLVDSIVLAEPPGDPLGAYISFFGITPSGGVVISDIASQRVLRFDAGGIFQGMVGRPGEGPGEFRMPAEIIALPEQQAFGVVDGNRSRLLIFGDVSGEFIREVELPFQRAGSSVARVDSAIILAPLMTTDALVRWNPSDNQFTSIAPLVLEAPGMQGIVMSMGVPGVARVDSTLLLWYPVLGLTRYSLDGSGAERIVIPARLRRGEGLDRVAEQMELRRAGSDSTLFSTTLGIGRLATGEAVLASLDATRTRSGGSGMRESDIRIYLTVLSADLQRACVDGLVPLVSDASSIMVMHDGDAHFLARNADEEGNVRTVMYRYRVALEGCDWVALSVGADVPER